MSIKLDQRFLTGAVANEIVRTSVIIGMTSPISKIPRFVLATIPEEQSQSSVDIASMQVSAGDLLQKVAVNSSRAAFTVILSDRDNFPAAWGRAVVSTIQQISNITNQIIDQGAIIPNLSNVSGDFAGSQLATLIEMKNNAQPIYILNSYMNLSNIAQSSPHLQSQWYIESINATKGEAQGGMLVDISIREMITKRDASLTAVNLTRNVASIATGGLTTGLF